MSRRLLGPILVALAAACAAPETLDTVPDRDRSTIAAESPVDADGQTVAKVTVTLRNAAGQPIPGLDVELTSLSSGVQLRQPLAATDENGVATGGVTSIAPVEAVVRARAAGVEIRQGAAIRFLAPCAAGTRRCGETCVDLANDEDHCGACDNACPEGASGERTCVEGRCGFVCSRLKGDCDEVLENGCETELASVEHCGGCGIACPTAENAVAICEEPLLSTCGLRCVDGFGSCDGDSANGCEQPLDVDAHCGACGNDCRTRAYAHGTGFCGEGRTCDVACDTGWGDCDGSIGTGCEQSLLARNHCGACGHVCPSPTNADGTCLGFDGTCGFACRAGWGDCNDDGVDGCETDTDVTLEHCGACGNACAARTNAVPSCADGGCAWTCAPGFADCNGDVSSADGDGCETDLSVGRCECQLSPTFASAACLVAGSGGQAAVGVQLRDGDGVTVEGATVTIEADGVTWTGPVEELEPGLYVRYARAGATPGTVAVQLEATAAECGGSAKLRPVRFELAEPASVGPEGGIGGCASTDGHVRVKVVRAEDGSPIENAFVMVGESAGGISLHTSYPVGVAPAHGPNTGRTGADGVLEFLDFGDALSSIRYVTAGADGRAYATVAGIAASDLVLALPTTSAPAQVRLSGSVSGANYPRNSDGNLELSLVTPTLDMGFVASFNILRLLSDDHAIDSSGLLPICNARYVVAGNIHVPGQSEVGCSITGGETWKVDARRGGPVDLLAVKARIPIMTLLQSSNASVPQLLSGMEVLEVGMLPAQPTSAAASGIQIGLTHALTKTMPVTVTGAPVGGGNTLYVLSLGDLDGGNGSGRMYLESFRAQEDAAGLTTTLETNAPDGPFAAKTDLAAAISVDGLATSLVLDRTTLDRTTPRTLTNFLAFPSGSVSGRSFTWVDVAGGGAAPELARSELRRVSLVGAYAESYEPFWIVWSPGDVRLGPGGTRGFQLPTLPSSAPRGFTGGYLTPSFQQHNEWFLALRQLGLAQGTNAFRLQRQGLGADTEWVTRVTTDRVGLP